MNLDDAVPVVIVGGEDDGSNIIDDVEVFDNHTSCKVDPLPTKLSSAAASIIINDKDQRKLLGLVCGGTKDQKIMESRCWQLNPNGKWTAGKPMLENIGFGKTYLVKKLFF